MTTHENPEQQSVREIARQLNSALGPLLVATLAGHQDLRTPHEWARVDGRAPSPEEQGRLRLAHRAWRTVSEVEGEDVARHWFIGGNPWLGDTTPLTAIRLLRTREVMRAATAIVAEDFSG
ncbi:hypothetical protein [Nesterenkonia sp. Act20]|uniref:hypothetical protein n=1 Tax=Nesterenkonia sp. Act20 TaxID=1483432 RepID=UPI001C44F83C|nr:hypothetical protein [Nesterenkonia sp. Act20]